MARYWTIQERIDYLARLGLYASSNGDLLDWIHTPTPERVLEALTKAEDEGASNPWAG